MFLVKGSDFMNFNHRGNPRVYTTGCSSIGCLLGVFIMISLIQGGLYFFFRYFWAFVLIGVVIWFFRQWNSNQSRTKHNSKQSQSRNTWHRDFEDKENTSYHNIERDFEEVDEEEDFNDF